MRLPTSRSTRTSTATSWSNPDIRWLLSTVPSAMIFDDHEVHDDWNISDSWIEEMRAKPWWHERVTGAFMAYFLYQHLGISRRESWRKNRSFTSFKVTTTAVRVCESALGDGTKIALRVAGHTTVILVVHGFSSSTRALPGSSSKADGR